MQSGSEGAPRGERQSNIPVKRMGRRNVLAGAALIAAVVPVAAACGSSGSGEAKKSSEPQAADLTFAPANKATNVPVRGTFTVTAKDGTLNPDVALVNDAGKVIDGVMSPDKTRFTVEGPLGYGRVYTWRGSSTGPTGHKKPISASFTTLNPDIQRAVSINIADGEEVGIAAPLILQFDGPIADKAAVERELKMTTNPPTEGSWAWLPDDGGARAHWRSKDFFAPGTKIHMEAKLYGLDYGDGTYGAQDVSSTFSIGRSQIVKADAKSHRIVVIRNGETTMTLPCSYGAADLDRNVTRSGIHVVSEKHANFYMSNPAAGYRNVHERYAVRISNNGEFIHANPETVDDQGSVNVTNGCINLSLANAERYYDSAIYGDPVEVTNTRIQLSAADGDIYDWTVDWPTWKSMSALSGQKSDQPTTGAVTPPNAPTTSNAPGGSGPIGPSTVPAAPTTTQTHG